MDDAKLVYMANQIGKFFLAKGEDAAAIGVADHLRRFWDPRMRAQLIAYQKAGGAGLEPAVAKAVTQLPAPPIA